MLLYLYGILDNKMQAFVHITLRKDIKRYFLQVWGY